jgi:hypothetical protein
MLIKVCLHTHRNIENFKIERGWGAHLHYASIRGLRFERDQRVFYARSSACPRFTLAHSVIRYYMFQLEK